MPGGPMSRWRPGRDAVEGGIEIGESRVPAGYLFDSVIALQFLQDGAELGALGEQ